MDFGKVSLEKFFEEAKVDPEGRSGIIIVGDLNDDKFVDPGDTFMLITRGDDGETSSTKVLDYDHPLVQGVLKRCQQK